MGRSLTAGEVVDGGGQHHVAQLRLVQLVGQPDQGLILGLKRSKTPVRIPLGVFYTSYG